MLFIEYPDSAVSFFSLIIPATLGISDFYNTPVKKKMLVEIFLGDRTKGAVDIKLNRVAQNTQEIIVDYEIIYDESDAGSEHRNPYLIIQTVRSKKQFVLIENGQRRTAGQRLYFDN